MQWLWRGRSVKLVDGTGLSMPDTPENQAVYPQPSSQARGVGFPLARLVMVICLATGAALDAAIGAHQGKGSGEISLVRQVLDSLRPGDVVLADALYCNDFLIASLMAAGVDVLFEQNGSRNTDFRRGRSLGTGDHIVRWPKPKGRPQWLTREQYTSAPEELELRECKVDHQVLVTTLRNHRHVGKDDLSQLYARRWNVELDLRNLKTVSREQGTHNELLRAGGPCTRMWHFQDLGPGPRPGEARRQLRSAATSRPGPRSPARAPTPCLARPGPRRHQCPGL